MTVGGTLAKAWRTSGERVVNGEGAVLRIHLSGRMCVDEDGERVGPDAFPGPQGRAAFAFLVGERPGPVSRSAMADALWPGSPPPSWDTAITSLVSKLRALLDAVGLDGTEVITASAGCYEIHLPSGSWVDHEVARDAIHEAEAALAAGEPRRAYGPSAVAHHIARRPFLPAEEGRWFERRRDTLRRLLLRALETRGGVYLWNDEHTLAVEAARELVALEPFRESGHRLLMRAHAGAGNTAEALRVYERCRELIADELGVSPSPETRELHDRLLRTM